MSDPMAPCKLFARETKAERNKEALALTVVIIISTDRLLAHKRHGLFFG